MTSSLFDYKQFTPHHIKITVCRLQVSSFWFSTLFHPSSKHPSRETNHYRLDMYVLKSQVLHLYVQMRLGSEQVFTTQTKQNIHKKSCHYITIKTNPNTFLARGSLLSDLGPSESKTQFFFHFPWIEARRQMEKVSISRSDLLKWKENNWQLLSIWRKTTTSSNWLLLLMAGFCVTFSRSKY